MKKILLISFMLLGALAINAQSVTLSLGSGTYGKVSTDWNATDATAVYAQINGEQVFAATQDVAIHLDSVSGNHTNVAVALLGRKFDWQTWSAIGSAVNWKGTTPDTSIVISNATANRYRQYKVSVTGTGTGVSKVDWLEFKVYNQ